MAAVNGKRDTRQENVSWYNVIVQFSPSSKGVSMPASQRRFVHSSFKFFFKGFFKVANHERLRFIL